MSVDSETSRAGDGEDKRKPMSAFKLDNSIESINDRANDSDLLNPLFGGKGLTERAKDQSHQSIG